MKILIYGEDFLPLVGGAPNAMALLAEGLANRQMRETGSTARNLEVTLVTRTPAGKMDDSSLRYRVVRRPGFLHLARLIWRADLVHIAGPCFLPLVLARLLRKPAIVKHHGYQAVCPNGVLLMEPYGLPRALRVGKLWRMPALQFANHGPEVPIQAPLYGTGRKCRKHLGEWFEPALVLAT
jgi:glycosyltransferase involved in cell wall biosynthesis